MNNEQKAPFDITQYPKETYTNSKGEEKERYIIPDDIFETHLKELPDNTVNESKSFRAFHGGKLGIFGADPEKDLEIQRAGREAQAAAYRQRRTFKEQVDILLATRDKNGKSCLENIIEAMYDRSQSGDVKAAQFLRDTAGEKPTDSIQVETMTEADRELMKDIEELMLLKGTISSEEWKDLE